jgi:hypothetical protein
VDDKPPVRPVAGLTTQPGSIPSLSFNSHSQTLFAADIAFGGLHSDMPEKKLDLLELAARIMAETRTGPPEIMWRETWNVHARGSLLDNLPDRLF